MNSWHQSLFSIYKKYQDAINIFILIIVPFIVFNNSLNSYFSVVDDFGAILHTQRSIGSVLTTNSFGGTSGGDYRPVEVISHQLDTKIFGSKSYYGRHVVNLLIHIFNGILIYFLCFYITRKKPIGLIAGILFAVYIFHANSISPVTWIAGRVDPLVTFFYLLTFILFIKFLSNNSYLVYFFSLFVFLLALLSKEMAVTLPLMMVFFVILFSDNVKTDKKFSKRYVNVLFISAIVTGILMIVAAIVLNPNFAASQFHHNAVLNHKVRLRIQAFQLAAKIGGGVLMAFTLLFFILLKLSKKIRHAFLLIRYSLPYFVILFFFLIVRFFLLSGFGGEYQSSGGNVILQLGVDSFIRDIFSLGGLVWPLGNQYNLDVFRLEIQDPFIFYTLGIILFSVLVLIFIKILKYKQYAFFYLWIFITIMPLHNILIPSWQFTPKYLYLSAVGSSILISALLYNFYNLIPERTIFSRLSKIMVVLLISSIILLSSLLIIKNNDKFIKDGKIIETFISDIKSYYSKISDKSDLYFITFPYLSVDSKSNIYISAYMNDLFRYMEKGYGTNTYNYYILSYVKNGGNKVDIKWLDDKNLIVDGMDYNNYLLIPNEMSPIDKKIVEIYGMIPHPIAQSLPPIGESKIYKLTHKNDSFALVKGLKLDGKTNKPEFSVEFNNTMNGDSVKNSLFFIYENGHFKLIKEYQY